MAQRLKPNDTSRAIIDKLNKRRTESDTNTSQREIVEDEWRQKNHVSWINIKKLYEHNEEF